MKAKMSFTRFGRLLVTAVTFALFLLGSATSARAAALSVVTSNPAAGATLPASPPAIRITFNQKIISAVTMTVTCNGVVVPVPPANASADQLDIVLDLSGTTPLPQGNCVAEWGAQPLAGGAVDKGSLSFSVAASAAPGGAASTQTTIAPAVVTPSGSGSKLVIDPPAVDGPLFLARLLSGVGLAALFGALVIIVTAWPEGVEYVLTIRFIRSAWILAMAATVGFVVCLTAKSTGVSIGNALNPKSWSDLTALPTAGSTGTEPAIACLDLG